MKIVKEMIATQMSVITLLNVIQTIQDTLTGQQLQSDLTQENYQQTVDTIVLSSLTQTSAPNTQTNNIPSSNEDQTSQDSHQQKTTFNSKRKKDKQLCLDETQEIIEEDDQNDNVMEDQENSNQTDRRNRQEFQHPINMKQKCKAR